MSKSTDFETEQACHTMDLADRNLANYTRSLRINRWYLGRLDEKFVPEDRRAELAKLKVDVEKALHALDGGGWRRDPPNAPGWWVRGFPDGRMSFHRVTAHLVTPNFREGHEGELLIDSGAIPSVRSDWWWYGPISAKPKG